MASVGLAELCSVIRAKNAGPFLFAVDLMFRDEAVYMAIKEQQLLTRELVAAAYGIPVAEVVVFQTCDHIRSIKATLRRRVVAGSRGDTDCYASQQEVPLLTIRLPREKIPETIRNVAAKASR